MEYVLRKLDTDNFDIIKKFFVDVSNLQQTVAELMGRF